MLLRIARELARELHPRGRWLRAGLGGSLDRDWGFDSLSRAELFLRIERSFGVSLPERSLGEVETLQDVLRILGKAHAAPPAAPRAAMPGFDLPAGEAAPFDVATLNETLDWHARRHPDRCHLTVLTGDRDEARLSYGELAARARRTAQGLRRRGVEPGDHVALMLPTGDAFFVAFFGILYAGAVPTPIYPPTRAAQIGEHLRRQAGILRNARAVTLIAGPEAHAAARLLAMQIDVLRRVETVETLAGEAGPTGEPLPKLAPEAAALLQYTSGSTGDPKGVVLTHANLLANIRAMGAALEVTGDDVFVSWLPLYHDMGLIGAWLGSLYYGVPLVVMSPLRFLVRPERWLWAIHRYRGTLSAAPNFAFELCLRKVEDAAIAGLDLSSLRTVANGSEPVSADTVCRFATRFGPYGFRPTAMAPVYGLAECAVGLAFPPMRRMPVIDRIDRRALTQDGKAVPAEAGSIDALELVACGHPLPGHQIRILGPTGELGERQEGRLQFTGPSATSGYFDNPEKSRELFDGEWLNSGDLAYVAGGDVFITGRSKDIIIRAGQHIYPQELEAAVGGVVGIRQGCVAVFGTPDPSAGTERVIVLAETRERDPERLAQLRLQVADVVAPLLQAPPEEILLVPPRTVPKTSSGKIRRSAARQLYEQGARVPRRLPVWRQLAALAMAGVTPQLLRARRYIGEVLYAGCWWAAIVSLGAVLWPLLLILPRRRWRWNVMHRMARLAFRVVGIAITVEEESPSPAQGVVVANHASYVDGLVLAAVLPGELAFVAKKELAAQRVAGPFLRSLGTLFVDRADPEGGVEDTSRASAAAKVGRRLVFLPEGTFTRAPGLLPFRLGAFAVAVRQSLPVIPVALRGTRSILRGDQWFPRRGAVTVRIAAPIMPDGDDFSAALRLRDKSRAAILARCGEPDLREP